MKFRTPDHSPHPFDLVPAQGVVSGHLIVDAIGDSIGGVAAWTGDHPREEQLANARLWRAAPELRELVIELVLDLAEANGDADPWWAQALIEPGTRSYAGTESSTERAERLFALMEPGE